MKPVMARPHDHDPSRALMVLAISAVAGLGVLALPLAGIDPWGHRVLAIVAVALVLWVGEALPIAATSILVVALLAVFGPGPSREATQAALYGFQLPAGYFLLGTLVIAAATLKSGLATRLAEMLVRSSGGSGRRVYLQLVALMPPIAIFIPSATTRNAILIPAYEDVFQRMRLTRGERLPRLISLAMATLPMQASTAVLTGGVVPVTAAFLLGGFSWMEWFAYMAVPNYAILLLCGLLLLVWQRPDRVRVRLEKMESPGGGQGHEVGRGAWSGREVRAALIIGTMTLLWLTDSWTGWDPVIPALLGAVTLMVPGLGVLTWKDFEATSPWPVFFVTGSALSIAHALETSGADVWFANALLRQIPLAHLPLPVVLLAMIAVTLLVNVMLPNRAGVLGILIPLLGSISAGLGLNPVPIGLMTVIVAQTTVFYPVQNAAVLMAYRTRHFAPFELLRAGLLLFATGTLVIFLIAIPWWALLGLPLRP